MDIQKFVRFPRMQLAAVSALMLLFSTLLPAINPVSAASVAGYRDPSFATGNGEGIGANNNINSTVVLSDGKILIGGAFASYNGVTRQGLARINSDGSLDPTFSAALKKSEYVSKLVLQPDGKILVAGNFSNYAGTSRNNIIRLNANGSLDTSFDPGTGTTGYITTLALQNDGKVLLGGTFTSFNAVNIPNLVRLNSDGSLDTGFTAGSVLNNSVYAVLIQPDSKLVITGAFTSVGGTVRNRIARLNNDGSLDTSFDPGTGASSTVGTAALQSDGKIMIGGGFSSFNGVTRRWLARINSDGSLDTSFDPGSGISGYDIKMVAIQPSNGKILIGGNFSSYNGSTNGYFVRVNTDGSVDTAFAQACKTPNDVLSIQEFANGQLLIAGAFSTVSGMGAGRIARLNTDGTVDNSFNSSSGLDSSINEISLQHQTGKLLVAGPFNSYKGVPAKGLARLNMDGSLDTGFLTGSGIDGSIYTMNTQADGKILLGGFIYSYNGTTVKNFLRLNSDGSLDSSFNNSGGPSSFLNDIQPLSTGKILIGGYFTTYGGTSINDFARLNNDGTLDTSFTTGTGPNNPVNVIYPLADDKILIGGSFTKYNGTSVNYLARLNSNGTLDTSFNTGSGANGAIYSIFVQSDGKILIGGSFTKFNGSNTGRFARLNSDGSLDSSFNAGSGANGIVMNISQTSEGKFIISGQFSQYNNNPSGYIARLNSDGSLDTDFRSSAGANSNISDMILLDDDSIIAAGSFTTYNNSPVNYLLKLANTTDGGVITTPAATTVTPVLTTDWSTSAVTVPQSGTLPVGVLDPGNGNTRIATMEVNFNAMPDWSGVTAGSGLGKSFFHAPQGIASITGNASNSFLLYVPKGDGSSVRICPQAVSLTDVSRTCPGGYVLTASDPNVSIVTENAVTYWKVSGLTGTGGMSLISGITEALTRQQAGALSDHQIAFGTELGLDSAGDSFTISFDNIGKAFDLGNLELSDIILSDSLGSQRVLAAQPGINTWGVTMDKVNDTITFTAPLSGTGYFAAASKINVSVGQADGSGNLVGNPDVVGLYYIGVAMNNDGVTERFDIATAIVDSDQVNITAFINTFVSFDIDAAVADTDCSYNGCLTHEAGGAAANYTVDLGELNSTWVNQSQQIVVKHSDGNDGRINSIYFDFTTNAYNGLILYVRSANGWLQGPDSNQIASVAADGDPIAANSGRYGFQLTDAGTASHGTINRAGCTTADTYCSLSAANREVLNTGGKPLDGGRVRMDIAAAAAYTNNPGSYTDTLTFTVVPTY